MPDTGPDTVKTGEQSILPYTLGRSGKNIQTVLSMVMREIHQGLGGSSLHFSELGIWNGSV